MPATPSPVPDDPLTGPAPPSRRRRWRRAVRRHVWGRRRLLAAVAAAVATLAALRVVAPPEPATVPVVVAATDRPAGAVLSPDDLVVARWPVGLAPEVSEQAPDIVVGRVLAAPVGAGEPVTTLRLVAPGRADPGAGRVVLPVRLTDASAAAMLRVGDVVDLVATPPQGGASRTVASGARVVTVAPPDDSGSLPGRLVVVAVGASEASEVTGASVREFVTWTFPR